MEARLRPDQFALYLFTIAPWLESDGVDPSRFPRVLAHRERMAGLPEVKKMLADVEEWS